VGADRARPGRLQRAVPGGGDHGPAALGQAARSLATFSPFPGESLNTLLLIPGAPLLSIALNANVLATVLLPVTLVFMILLASDRQLMGRRANTVSLNMAAAAIVTVVAGCGAAYGIDSFLQAARLIPGG
jgi:Mn2+/Fe2+ NRAMP family transporter